MDLGRPRINEASRRVTSYFSLDGRDIEVALDYSKGWMNLNGVYKAPGFYVHVQPGKLTEHWFTSNPMEGRYSLVLGSERYSKKELHRLADLIWGEVTPSIVLKMLGKEDNGG